MRVCPGVLQAIRPSVLPKCHSVAANSQLTAQFGSACHQCAVLASGSGCSGRGQVSATQPRGLATTACLRQARLPRHSSLPLVASGRLLFCHVTTGVQMAAQLAGNLVCHAVTCGFQRTGIVQQGCACSGPARRILLICCHASARRRTLTAAHHSTAHASHTTPSCPVQGSEQADAFAMSPLQRARLRAAKSTQRLDKGLDVTYTFLGLPWLKERIIALQVRL
jgi:hypothetical protein